MKHHTPPRPLKPRMNFNHFEAGVGEGGSKDDGTVVGSST